MFDPPVKRLSVYVIGPAEFVANAFRPCICFCNNACLYFLQLVAEFLVLCFGGLQSIVHLEIHKHRQLGNFGHSRWCHVPMGSSRRLNRSVYFALERKKRYSLMNRSCRTGPVRRRQGLVELPSQTGRLVSVSVVKHVPRVYLLVSPIPFILGPSFSSSLS